MKFGYARVSTQEQTTDRQIDALMKYGVDEIYEEKITGTLKNRPQLDLLLSKLRKDDTLVIYDLKRLGRNSKQLISLAEEFNKKGIGLVSLNENLDTTTPIGQFMFTLLCALAQLDRDIIVENTKSGLEAARARGRHGGRPKIDPKKVSKAIKMYKSQQFTIKEITETTGISKASLYVYLSDRRESPNK